MSYWGGVLSNISGAEVRAVSKWDEIFELAMLGINTRSLLLKNSNNKIPNLGLVNKAVLSAL